MLTPQALALLFTLTAVPACGFQVREKFSESRDVETMRHDALASAVESGEESISGIQEAIQLFHDSYSEKVDMVNAGLAIAKSGAINSGNRTLLKLIDDFSSVFNSTSREVLGTVDQSFRNTSAQIKALLVNVRNLSGGVITSIEDGNIAAIMAKIKEHNSSLIQHDMAHERQLWRASRTLSRRLRTDVSAGPVCGTAAAVLSRADESLVVLEGYIRNMKQMMQAAEASMELVDSVFDNLIEPFIMKAGDQVPDSLRSALQALVDFHMKLDAMQEAYWTQVTAKISSTDVIVQYVKLVKSILDVYCAKVDEGAARAREQV